MAHNLYFDEKKDQYSFFSVKKKPWHGLGQIIHDYPTSAEALRFAGLDYTLEKRPLFVHHQRSKANGEKATWKTIIPDLYAVVRTDNETVLGTVSERYQIVQNSDAFSFFDSIVGGDGIQYETAGALGKGERIFITAKLPDYIKVGRDDLIEKYLFLTTAHNGSGSVMAAFTPVRIVCQNTLNAALSHYSNTIRIRHTVNAKERIEQAHEVMGISNQLGNKLEEIFNQWAKIKITDHEVKRLIQIAMAPQKEVVNDLYIKKYENLPADYREKVEKAFEYAMSSPTQSTITTAGTLFGAYNAVAGYFQNASDYKNEETKIKSLLLGGLNQRYVQVAFNLCLSYSENGINSLMLN